MHEVADAQPAYLPVVVWVSSVSCVWASLAVTDTASRLRMRHTTPSSATVLRLLRVGFPIPFVSQTHSPSIAPFSADLLLVHRRCTLRLW
jgi:hypothetical protein